MHYYLSFLGSVILSQIFHAEGDIEDKFVSAEQEHEVLNMNNYSKPKKVDNIFICEYCDKYFTLKSQFKIHMHSHTKPFVCHQCSRSFSRRADLKRHWRVHSGEKPYKCNACDYSTANFSGLKFHTEKKHQSYH